MDYSNSLARKTIEEYIHNQRDREMMCRRLIDGITYEQLAEEFNMSVSQVKRIIWKNSEIVFRKMKMS